MAFYQVKKVVIITEKIISEEVCQVLESFGATGYTLLSAGGKGSRNIRSNPDRAFVVDDFANIKVEVIVNSEKTAQHIMEEVTGHFFNNFSGITYMESVEIIRSEKFEAKKKID